MNDLDADLIAALRLVGDLIKKAADDDLRALLAGEAKLKIVPAGWRVVPPAAPKPPPVPKAVVPPASVVRAQLIELRGAESRRALLVGLGMNSTQARKLATDLGVRGAGRSTASEAIDRIIGYFADSDSEPADAARY
jgi:hypothetical protein